MKKLLLFFTIFGFATGAKSQVLNGGFEDWTNGQPDDWSVVRGVLDTNSHSGKYCFGVQYADIGGPGTSGDAGTAFSNSTSLDPEGSFIPKDVNAISFWYSITGTLYDVKVSINNDTFGLGDRDSIWRKFVSKINSGTNNLLISWSAAPAFDYFGELTQDVYIRIDDVLFQNIAEVKNGTSTNEITISPNPISSHGILRYDFMGITSFKASLFDLTGRKVMTLPTVSSASGDGIIPFDSDGLSDGMYYLRFEAGGEILMRKIMVQH